MSITLAAGDTYSLTTGVHTTRAQRIIQQNHTATMEGLRMNDLDTLYSAIFDDPSIPRTPSYAY
jgi:hypothetical protein